MSGERDLLVLGGGPAGAALAALAARAGARVTVVERDRFPRDKVCGEFLSAEGCAVLDRLGLLSRLRAAGATRIGHCRVTTPAGRSADSPLPRLSGGGRAGLGISRERLDLELLSLAAFHGAEVLEGHRMREPVWSAGAVRGARIAPTGKDRLLPILSKVTVAADGRRSALARLLHPRLCDPQRTGARSWFGLKCHLSGGASSCADRVELHLFDGGYAGLVEIEGSRTNLCMLVTVRALRACDGDPDRVVSELLSDNPRLAAAIEGGHRCSAWKSVGPLRFGARRAASHGALFVGDAAGTVDPYAGEGMAHALRGAELALPYVLRGIERGGLDRATARDYAGAWSRAFGPATRRMRGIGRLLERPALAGPLIGLLAGPVRAAFPALVAATRTDPRD